MTDHDTKTAPTFLEEGVTVLPATDAFTVRDAVALGERYGDYTVTYVGPNFLRLFGDAHVEARPERSIRHHSLGQWADDEAVFPNVGTGGSLADLFAVLSLGSEGPGRFEGQSVTIYQEANGERWTPHFYTRGNRLGFGALPYGDAVGWEPTEVFVGGRA